MIKMMIKMTRARTATTTTNILLLLSLATVGTMALNELCTVPGTGVGTCVSKSRCASAGGKSVAGLCPGGRDVHCCVNVVCAGGSGLCMPTTECPGTPVAGKCPGSADFRCCTQIPCDDARGTCKSTSTCTGTAVAGKCPGPRGFVCCEGSGPTPPPTPPTGAGDAVAAAAEAMVGRYPYSYGGGNDRGATRGVLMKISPYCDDRGVVGFDCSGLSKYAVFQGTGRSIYHGATHQYNEAPQQLPLASRQRGDLLFYGSSLQDIHHVTIYVGDNMMVEASGHNPDCSGVILRKVAVRTKNLLPNVARYW